MSSEMSSQEILSFQGHEFTYIFEDGDTIPAYIKKIDLDKHLLSCWSFSLTSDKGHKFEPLNKEEKIEGACCLLWRDSLDEIISLINDIKSTGKYLVIDTGFGDEFKGCPL